MTRLALLLLLSLSVGCSPDSSPTVPLASAFVEPPPVTLESSSDRITGKVIRVADGDTLTILNSDKEKMKVRFNGIDSPEKAQAFGDKAGQALTDLVAGKTVEIVTHGIDKYDRTIGDVYHDGELVKWFVTAGPGTYPIEFSLNRSRFFRTTRFCRIL